MHSGRVARALARDVARGRYVLEPGELRTIRVRDKLREVYTCRLTDLIVHGVVAEIVREATAPSLSARVYSYRPGTSWAEPVTRFAGWLRAHRRAEPDPLRRGVYVLRGDVDSYTDSIPLLPGSPVWSMLEHHLGAPLHPLVVDVVRPRLRTRDGIARRDRGLPMGQPIAPVLANLYLGALDTLLAAEPDGFSARYGDDFLFAHPDPGVFAAAVAGTAGVLDGLAMTVNATKRRIVYLTPAGRPAPDGVAATGAPDVTFLGARIRADGTVGLDRAKVRALLRDVDRRAAATAATVRPAPREAVGRAVCAAVNHALRPRTRHRRAALGEPAARGRHGPGAAAPARPPHRRDRRLGRDRPPRTAGLPRRALPDAARGLGPALSRRRPQRPRRRPWLRHSQRHRPRPNAGSPARPPATREWCCWRRRSSPGAPAATPGTGCVASGRPGWSSARPRPCSPSWRSARCPTGERRAGGRRARGDDAGRAPVVGRAGGPARPDARTAPHRPTAPRTGGDRRLADGGSGARRGDASRSLSRPSRSAGSCTAPPARPRRYVASARAGPGAGTPAAGLPLRGLRHPPDPQAPGRDVRAAGAGHGDPAGGHADAGSVGPGVSAVVTTLLCRGTDACATRGGCTGSSDSPRAPTSVAPPLVAALRGRVREAAAAGAANARDRRRRAARARGC